MPETEAISVLFATLAGASLVVALLLALIVFLGKIKGRAR